jgi:hypothetical protein
MWGRLGQGRRSRLFQWPFDLNGFSRCGFVSYDVKKYFNFHHMSMLRVFRLRVLFKARARSDARFQYPEIYAFSAKNN